DALLDPRISRLSGDLAEAVELHAGVFRAEPRQDFDILDRDEELVVAGIEHAYAIMRRAGNVDRLQCLVAADAVIVMDDEIARRQRRRLGDELVEAAPPARRAREPVAEDVLLAEQHEIVGREALLDRQYGEPDRRARQSLELPAIGDAADFGNAAFAQYRQETVGRSQAERGNRGLATGFALGFEV